MEIGCGGRRGERRGRGGEEGKEIVGGGREQKGEKGKGRSRWMKWEKAAGGGERGDRGGSGADGYLEMETRVQAATEIGSVGVLRSPFSNTVFEWMIKNVWVTHDNEL